jgi:hypothetical protein
MVSMARGRDEGFAIRWGCGEEGGEEKRGQEKESN